jgi:hypothetical protein
MNKKMNPQIQQKQKTKLSSPAGFQKPIYADSFCPAGVQNSPTAVPEISPKAPAEHFAFYRKFTALLVSAKRLLVSFFSSGNTKLFFFFLAGFGYFWLCILIGYFTNILILWIRSCYA